MPPFRLLTALAPRYHRIPGLRHSRPNIKQRIADELSERRCGPRILHSTADTAVASFNAGSLSRRNYCDEEASFSPAGRALSSPRLPEGSLKKVELTSAFHGDDGDWMPENIEHACPRLLNLGADVVMLVEENTEWGEFDGEDVTSVVELVLCYDIPDRHANTPRQIRDRGPLCTRIGLRASPSLTSAKWREQVEAALDLDVRHFDFCPDGGRRAPSLDALTALLDERCESYEVVVDNMVKQ